VVLFHSEVNVAEKKIVNALFLKKNI